MNTVLMVLLVLSNAASQASVPRPLRVSGPGYEGAIVPPRNSSLPTLGT